MEEDWAVLWPVSDWNQNPDNKPIKTQWSEDVRVDRLLRGIDKDVLETHPVFSPFFFHDCRIVEPWKLIWGFAFGRVTCCSSDRACACWRSACFAGGLWPLAAGEWGSWRGRPSSQGWPCRCLTSLWQLGGTQVSGGNAGHPPSHSPRVTEHC